MSAKERSNLEMPLDVAKKKSPRKILLSLAEGPKKGHPGKTENFKTPLNSSQTVQKNVVHFHPCH